MKNTCTNAQHLMAAELDGDLAAADRAGLGDHLVVCPRCQEERARLRLSVALLEALPRPEPGPTFAAATLRKARLAREAQLSRERRLGRHWPLMAIALGAATVAGLRASNAWEPVASWLLSLTPRCIHLSESLFRTAGNLRNDLAPVARGLLVSLASTINALLTATSGAGQRLWEGALPVYVLALVTLACLAALGHSRAMVGPVHVEEMR
jgi:anti-sigma factor RsiW